MILGFYWCAVLGSNHISVGQRWTPRGNLWCEVCRKPWFTPTLEIRTVFQELSFKKLSSPTEPLLQKVTYVWNICKSLTVEIQSIFYFCWGRQLLSCPLDSVQSQTPGRKERTRLTPPRTGLPLGTRGLSHWMEIRKGDREAMSVLGFQVKKPGSLSWVLTSLSHTFSFSVHLTNVTVHQSFIFLSETVETENKLKSSFTKHGCWTFLTRYWTWANINLVNSPNIP